MCVCASCTEAHTHVHMVYVMPINTFPYVHTQHTYNTHTYQSAQVEALQKRIAERDAIHEKELKSKDMEVGEGRVCGGWRG